MKTFDIMGIYKTSTKDSCDTLSLCLEGEEDFIKEGGSSDEDLKKDCTS